MSRNVAALVALIGLACPPQRKHRDPKIVHLKWGGGLQAGGPDSFYGDIKTNLEQRGTRIERDGNDFTITTDEAWCDKTFEMLQETVPNGVELRCRFADPYTTVWVMDRK